MAELSVEELWLEMRPITPAELATGVDVTELWAAEDWTDELSVVEGETVELPVDVSVEVWLEIRPTTPAELAAGVEVAEF